MALALLFCDSFSHETTAGGSGQTYLGPKWGQFAIAGPSSGSLISPGRYAGLCYRIENTGFGEVDLYRRPLQIQSTGVVISFDVRFGMVGNGWPSQSTKWFFTTGGVSDISLTLNLTTSGHIEFRAGGAGIDNSNGTTIGTSATALSLQTWYHFDILLNSSGMSCYVEGSLFYSDAHNYLPSSPHAYVDTVGVRWQNFGSGSSIDICNFSFWGSTTGTDISTYSPGANRVDPWMPTSDVSVNYTPSTGSSNYAVVDEIPWNDDTDYVSGAGTSKKDLYGIASPALTGWQPIAAALNLRARITSGSGDTLNAIVKPTSTEYAAGAFALTTSYLCFQYQWTANPDGGAWTYSALGSAAWGEANASGSDTVRITQAAVEIVSSVATDQTVDVGALGPHRSLPSPTVSLAHQYVDVGALGPHRSFPTPDIGTAATLIIAALGPHRNFFTPSVQLSVLSVGALGPHRSFPAPLVTTQQIITFTIASPFTNLTLYGPRSLPSPRVAHVTTIAMGTLGPHRSFPAPLVTGGPQWINSQTLYGPRRFPPPTVIGGTLSTDLYLSGVRIPQLSWRETAIVESQTIGRWRASFALENPGTAPVLGQTVLIVDYGRRLFAGCISEVTAERYLSTNYTVWHCVAQDKSGICDHRVVTGATYPSGTDVAFVILDVLANFLDGEGISAGPEITLGAFGVLDADMVYNFPTVTTAYDQLATQAGLVWWVDSYCILHFSPLADLPAAPFGLTETSYNWRHLLAKATTQDYYNKLYAVSNLNILPGGSSGGAGGGVSETFTFTAGQPGIRTSVDAGTGDVVATGIICSTAVGSVQSLTVNGVDQTVVDFGAFAGQVPNPPDLLWFFAGPATGSPNQFVSPSVLPSAGALIVITYTPAATTASSLAQYGTALDPLNPEGDPLGTCGSGIYEGVVQVQNISDQEQLNNIAAAVLAKIGGIPQVISYQTDVPGLSPGMVQSINIPLSQCDNLQCLITSVRGQMPEKGAGVDLGYQGAFRYDVEARTNLDPGNWAKWFERLIARTDNPLPLALENRATFVLGSGTSLSSGNTQTNPFIVSRTGLLTSLLIAAATPPTGQDLTVVLTRNNVALPAEITLPGGGAANTLYTVTLPASPQVYLFSQDILNVNVFYSGTGGTPTAAAKVTFTAVWMS